MSKPHSEHWHNRGEQDESKGAKDNHPHGFMGDIANLFDGDYEKRVGENRAYEKGRENTRNQKDGKR